MEGLLSTVISHFTDLKQVLTGHPPFFKLTETGAVYSMLKGDRSHQPNQHKISDGIWHMVEQCVEQVWYNTILPHGTLLLT